MYRNVGPWYCSSGLSLEVGLSSQWSLVADFTISQIHGNTVTENNDKTL